MGIRRLDDDKGILYSKKMDLYFPMIMRIFVSGNSKISSWKNFEKRAEQDRGINAFILLLSCSQDGPVLRQCPLLFDI